MFFSILFSILAFYDNYGVRYNDNTMYRLELTINTLTKYTIPAKTEIISGGNGVSTQSSSAFYPCRNQLTELYFEEGSLLKTIEPYGISYMTKLEELDFSMCHKLISFSYCALYKCTSLRSMKFPPNLQTIETGSFGYTALVHAEFPPTLQKIGGWSSYGNIFGSCSQLESISWGVNPSITSIGNCAFTSCGLKSIFIPKSLTSISTEVFVICPIEKIEVEEGHTKFSTDGKILYNQDKTEIRFTPSSETGVVSLIDSVTILGDGAFMRCQIETVEITDKITKIGADCFMYSEITHLTIPSSVTSINNRAINQCRQLRTLIFEANVKSIPTEMCSGCTKLERFSFPNSTTTIGKYALRECAQLDYIFIPKSVTTINEGAFSGVNLTAIYDFEEGSPLRYVDGYLYNSNYTTIVAYIGSETNFNVYINKSVETIGSYSFKGLKVKGIIFNGTNCRTIATYAFAETSIETLNIVSSIKEIQKGAFQKCKSLTTLTFEDGIESILESAFEESTISSQLIFPKSLKIVSNYAFKSCNKISMLTFLPNCAIEEIGTEAFKGTGITSVCIPRLIVDIKASAFSGSSLNMLTFESHTFTTTTELDNVPERSFKDCTGLKTIKFIPGIRTINQNAFEGCTSLENLEIGEDIETICTNSFKDCTALRSFTIPDSSKLSSIESLAFDGCSNLKSFIISENHPSFSTEDGVLFNRNKTAIVLYLPAHPRVEFEVPSTVNRLQIFSFQNAVNLVRISLPESISSIEYGCFMGCTGLTSVNIPSTVTNIARDVFSGCNSLACGSIVYDREMFNELIEAAAPVIGLTPCPTSLFTAKNEMSEVNALLIALVIDDSDSE